MKKRNRIILGLIAVGALFLLGLLIVLFLTADDLINSRWSRSRLQAELSKALGGDVRLGKIEVYFFPRLCLNFHDFSLKRPDGETAVVKVLKACPDTPNLLRGYLELEEITLQGPDVILAKPTRGKEEPLTPAIIEKEITPFLGVLEERAPELKVSIKNGRLRVPRRDGKAYAFENINAAANLTPNALDLNGTIDSSPWGAINLKGQASHEPGKLQITNLDGKIGNSSTTGMSALLQWDEKSTYLKTHAGASSLLMEEIQSLDFVRDAIETIFWHLTGTVNLSTISFEGPLKEPSKWRYALSGSLKDIVAEPYNAPGPIEISGADFDANQQLLSFRNAHAGLIDSLLDGQGSVQVTNGTKLGAKRFLVSGKIGNETIQWSSQFYSIPAGFKIPSSFIVRKADVSWTEAGHIAVNGVFVPEGGPVITLDLDRNPKSLAVKKALIKDEFSDAVISLALADDIVDLDFSGSLAKETVDYIYENNQPEGAIFSGDFKARLPLHKLANSTGKGSIYADNILLPFRDRDYILENFGLRAAGEKLRIESATLSWGDESFHVGGFLRKEEEKFIIDLDIITAGFDLETSLLLLTRSEAPQSETGISAWPPEWMKEFPVSGNIRMLADRMFYKKFMIEDVMADLSLTQERMETTLRKSSLCGLPTPGVFTRRPEGFFINVNSRSVNQDFSDVLACLLGRDAGATGKFDFDAEISARDDIWKTIQGKGELIIRDGRIYRMNLLSRILEFLNITQLLTGRVPDLAAEGVPFDRIRIRGTMKGEIIGLTRITMEGPTLTIAGNGTVNLGNKEISLTLLVSPLRTVDYVISKIPVVRHVLKRIIAVPVQVSGDWNNPTVIPLSPEALGSQVIGIMKSIIRIPFHLIRPLTK